MSLRKYYVDNSDAELVGVVENPEYTEEARITAAEILKEREIPPDVLKKHAKKYFKTFFYEQISGTILTSMEEPELPESLFLSEKQLRKLISKAFLKVTGRRRDFYSNLPKSRNN